MSVNKRHSPLVVIGDKIMLEEEYKEKKDKEREKQAAKWQSNRDSRRPYGVRPSDNPLYTSRSRPVKTGSGQGAGLYKNIGGRKFRYVEVTDSSASAKEIAKQLQRQGCIAVIKKSREGKVNIYHIYFRDPS